MKRFIFLTKDKINQLPITTGVYLFYEKKQNIYIGKAIDIKNRVKNHFQQPSYRDNLFINKVTKIGFLQTHSEIEALVLEASLIKKYQPKFNVAWRDDKNYFYVAIIQNKNKTRALTSFSARPSTKIKNFSAPVPYVFITHQPFDTTQSKPKSQDNPFTNSRELVNWYKSKIIPVRHSLLPVRISTQTGGAGGNHKSKIDYIGPFVEGNALKKSLKFLRRVFPFYTSAKHPRNRCTWCHLDLCPGPLLFENPPSLRASADAKASAFDKSSADRLEDRSADLQEYKNNIKKLVLILKGKRKNVLNSLKKEMNSLSKNKEFEKALKVRDRINVLQQVMAHAKVLAGSDPAGSDPAILENTWNKTQTILQRLLKMKKPISKIECYDISNIQGKYATGSMVVFVNGKPDKDQYRKFRIKMKQEPNDIAMLKEVLRRRFLHSEWPYPEIMLIDGGIAQLNIAVKAKKESRIFFKALKKIRDIELIKMISIAKGKQELFIAASGRASLKITSQNFEREDKPKVIPLKNLPQDIHNLILHLDDEAHRFAISYHKNLRKKALLS